MSKIKFGSMRLPDNLTTTKDWHITKQELLAKRDSNELHDIYKFVCERMGMLDVQVSPQGEFYFEDKLMNINSTWLIMRKDIEAAGFKLSKKALRHVVETSIKYLVKSAQVKAIEEGDTVKVRVI
jgi:hypothetical protein